MILTFARRVFGALSLDAATYEDVEADVTATPQALVVIVLSSLAAGVGARGAAGAASTLMFFAWASVLALAAWAAFAVLVYQVGSRLLPTPDTHVDIGQLLRTLGFAAAPGLFQVFALFTGLTVPVFVIAILWSLAASVVAIRQALDYTGTTRALAVCGVAWLLSILVVVVLGAVVASI
jgi:hypothetical protein